MSIDTSNNFWQVFALSGDPLAYLDYSRSRQGNGSGFEGRRSENREQKVRRG